MANQEEYVHYSNVILIIWSKNDYFKNEFEVVVAELQNQIS